MFLSHSYSSPNRKLKINFNWYMFIEEGTPSRIPRWSRGKPSVNGSGGTRYGHYISYVFYIFCLY